MLCDGETPSSSLADEEVMRAHIYALLGRLLAAPPDGELLTAVGRIVGDETPLGRALDALSAAARAATAEALASEYHALFIGVTGGEVTPYASWYLTGFLHEKPLAAVRADLGRLGVARADGVSEPEDHAAVLCEVMAGLIGGAFGAPLDLAGQRAFHDRHIGPWMPKFLADLEAAPAARFYRAVAAVGRRFLEVEGYAFELAA